MYLDESGRKIEEGKKNVKSGNCDIELSTSFFFFHSKGIDDVGNFCATPSMQNGCCCASQGGH